MLKVISRSTFDLQPVLDTVVETAARLCDADSAVIARREGELLRGAAYFGYSPEYRAWITSLGANPLERRTVGHRAVLEGRVVHVHDVAADPNYPPELIVLGKQRTSLGVPLLREGEATGMIVLTRQRVEPFTDRQIELVSTFADQAVIAIENTRLITEQREALEQQTATADVLKIISHSAFDLPLVLETLVETATRICGAAQGYVFRLEAGRHRLVASFGATPEFVDFLTHNPFNIDYGTLSGRVELQRGVVHIEDAASDPDYTWTEAQRRGNLRTGLGVPLLRESTVIGILVLYRSHVERFTDKQIALVTTFADQAVIAIENARLLGELRERTDELARSVDELKALNEVSQAVSSTLDLEQVLSTILARSISLSGADAGVGFSYSKSARTYRLVEAQGWDAELVERVSALHIDENETGMGEAAARRMPLQFYDLATRPSYPLRDITLASGFHSVLIVPLLGVERIFGAIVLVRRSHR